MGDALNKNEDLTIIFNTSSAEEIEAVLESNPQFRDMNFIQLKDDKDFQQALKDYKLYSQQPLTDSKTLKEIKKISSNLTNNTALITDKDLKHALSPYKNPYAYIQQLDEDFFEQLEFNPENGTMNIENNALETITLQNVKTRSNLKELDLPLLRSLYTIIYCYADKIDTDTVTISLPTLAKHLGINIRGDKPNDLFAKIKAFDNVIGVFENGSFYRLLTFLRYDRNINTITFGSPYMNKILRTLQQSNTITPKTGKQFLNPHYSYLIHGTIANERNKPAIEIVNAIVTLLHQRGVEKPPKPNLTVNMLKRTVKNALQEEFSGIKDLPISAEQPNLTTMHKKISTIIEEIPILVDSLESPAIDQKTKTPKPKTAQDKNKILSRAFSGAYTLLKTKTDIYKYFIDLQVSEIIPTVSTIDQIIEISHAGINEKYKKM
jgi:hypothetical protein